MLFAHGLWLHTSIFTAKTIGLSASRLVLGTGTRGRYPLTGYPGIFITRLLSTQQCSYGCEFGVIYNVYHEFNVYLHAHCKYECTTPLIIA